MMKITLKPFASRNDDELMALTAWGEARNQGSLGMLAISHVILNRLADQRKRFGRTIKGVILRRWAFSCFNPADPNLTILSAGPTGDVIAVCRAIASLTLSGLTIDPTEHATHYYNPKVCDPFTSGAWKKELMTHCIDIGNHHFYREI